MDKISLKIIIAGRTYPLTIKKEEEEAIRQAADRINANIKKLQGTYAVKDMQDLLAMTTLQFTVQANAKQDGTPTSHSPEQISFDSDIQAIIDKIEEKLS